MNQHPEISIDGVSDQRGNSFSRVKIGFAGILVLAFAAGLLAALIIPVSVR